MKIPKLKSKIFKALLLTTVGAGLLTIVDAHNKTARADIDPPECYRVLSHNSPFTADDTDTQQETWCYKKLDDPRGAKLIYQVDDQGRTRPELAIMVEADGTIRHASRVSGVLTFHRVEGATINPIGAPLTPPRNAKRVSVPIAPSDAESAEGQIRVFQEYGNIPIYAAKISEGTVQVGVPQSSLPWRGYWYPYSSQRMYRGDDSPLAKYDKFIARRASGVNPGAQQWEIRNHSGGVAWSGHCNGWAAASIMTAEPKKDIKDPFTGILFSTFDLKAFLIERNYCPKLVFYGQRNRGGPHDDPRDIYPAPFHNVITYFLGQLHKPVLVDLMPGVPIQNSVISGYTMKTTRIGANAYDVRTTATIHLYDEKPSNDTGVARSIQRLYHYVLTTDNNGNVVNGSWISDNPDFLWVPLAPADCPEKNPVVEQFWIDEINRVSK